MKKTILKIGTLTLMATPLIFSINCGGSSSSSSLKTFNDFDVTGEISDNDEALTQLGNVDENGIFISQQIQELSDIKSTYIRDEWTDFDLNSMLLFNNVTATVYKTKYINFAFDNDINLPENEIKNMIKYFFTFANYGYGLTNIDTILFTNKDLYQGSLGFGSESKDLIIHMNEFSQIDGLNKQNFQQTLDSLIHEYGHHESMMSSELVGGEDARFHNIIAHNAPNAELYDSVIKQDSTSINEYTQNILNSIDGHKYKDIYSSPQFIDIFDITLDAENTFDLNYQYSKYEYLTRTMNVLESFPIYGSEYILSSPIILMDIPSYHFSTLDNSESILDPSTALYNQNNLNNVINIWKDYVYGYGQKLNVNGGEIYGYSNKDFDFVALKIGGETPSTEIVNLKKVESHFLNSRETYFKQGFYTEQYYAYKGSFPSWVNSNLIRSDKFKPRFIKDSNGNGSYDITDEEVLDVQYNWTI